MIALLMLVQGLSVALAGATGPGAPDPIGVPRECYRPGTGDFDRLLRAGCRSALGSNLGLEDCVARTNADPAVPSRSDACVQVDVLRRAATRIGREVQAEISAHLSGTDAGKPTPERFPTEAEDLLLTFARDPTATDSARVEAAISLLYTPLEESAAALLADAARATKSPLLDRCRAGGELVRWNHDRGDLAGLLELAIDDQLPVPVRIAAATGLVGKMSNSEHLRWLVLRPSFPEAGRRAAIDRLAALAGADKAASSLHP